MTRPEGPIDDSIYRRVVEQSRDNPVFYVQYAHARIASILRKAGQQAEAIARRRFARARNASGC